MACSPWEQMLSHICLQTHRWHKHCPCISAAARWDQLPHTGLPLSAQALALTKANQLADLLKRSIISFPPRAKVRSVDGKNSKGDVLVAAVPCKQHYLAQSTGPFTGITNDTICDLIATINPFWLRSGPQNFIQVKNALPLRKQKIRLIFLQQIFSNNMSNFL